MQPFRYWRDPVCLGCTLAYTYNRWLVKPHFHSGFFHSYFNDLLLIPCALPLFLWLHRQLGLRAHDRPPRVSEAALHLVLWSVLFEVIGPHLMAHVTGDVWDAVAYAVGGAAALAVWRWGELSRCWKAARAPLSVEPALSSPAVEDLASGPGHEL